MKYSVSTARLLLTSLIGLCLATALFAEKRVQEGMSLIPAGEFEMGSRVERAWAEEQPAHKVRISRAFLFDQTEVTNAQFQRFVAATGYKTVAEKPVPLKEIMSQLPAGAPPPTPDKLQPGSMVFELPYGEVNLRDVSRWWKWTHGANWRAPEGPKSSLKGREQHPVVHLAWEDAKAFCRWAGKRLPTEAEWERAARGGVDGLAYIWGGEKPNDAARKGWFANIWQGVFPTKNTATDGFESTAPVRSYKPNPYGLYDMAGNVWEWIADWYDPDAYQLRVGQTVIDPTGPEKPVGRDMRRVQRGGSYLCHESYCTRYRPGARQGAAPESGTSHAGVRCAKSVS